MSRTFLLLATLLLAGTVRAETINCTPIASLPATLSSQGVYCLKQDLSTAIATGNAITVAVNNVTIDCNGYKLGGLAAGITTRAYGIRADGRVNTVVRNCNVRGFFAGMWMQGGAGHVIESNRLEGNTYTAVGIFASDGDLVRDNFIVDTGGHMPTGSHPFGAAFGIGGQAAGGLVIVGNTILNTHATAGSGRSAYGIGLFDAAGLLEGNRIAQTLPDGVAVANGILLNSLNTQMIVRGNSIINGSVTPGAAISVQGSATGVLKDNVSMNFASGFTGIDGGGNFAN